MVASAHDRATCHSQQRDRHYVEGLHDCLDSRADPRHGSRVPQCAARMEGVVVKSTEFTAWLSSRNYKQSGNGCWHLIMDANGKLNQRYRWKVSTMKATYERDYGYGTWRPHTGMSYRLKDITINSDGRIEKLL